MSRLIVAAFVFVLAANSASADVVERVVATVNNQAIFLSDLRKRAVPFLPQVADAATETERMSRLKDLYEELLTVLIDEQLIRQLATSSGIRVTDADVDNAIENSLYGWRASGKELEALKGDETLDVELQIVLNSRRRRR